MRGCDRNNCPRDADRRVRAPRLAILPPIDTCHQHTQDAKDYLVEQVEHIQALLTELSEGIGLAGGVVDEALDEIATPPIWKHFFDAYTASGLDVPQYEAVCSQVEKFQLN